MVKETGLLAAFIGLWLTGTAFSAGVIPGRWEKVDALTPGTQIVVQMKSGDRIEGAFAGTGTNSIILFDVRGSKVELPKTAIKTTHGTTKIPDRLRNGILIGAGAGALAGVLSLVGFAKEVTASGPIYDSESAPILFGAGLVGAGVGAAVGGIIDSRIKAYEVIYRAAD